MCSVQLPLQHPQHHAGHQTRQTQILPKTKSMIGQVVAFDNAYLNRNVPYFSIAIEEFLNDHCMNIPTINDVEQMEQNTMQKR